MAIRRSGATSSPVRGVQATSTTPTASRPGLAAAPPLAECLAETAPSRSQFDYDEAIAYVAPQRIGGRAGPYQGRDELLAHSGNPLGGIASLSPASPISDGLVWRL